MTPKHNRHSEQTQARQARKQTPKAWQKKHKGGDKKHAWQANTITAIKHKNTKALQANTRKHNRHSQQTQA